MIMQTVFFKLSFWALSDGSLAKGLMSLMIQAIGDSEGGMNLFIPGLDQKSGGSIQIQTFSSIPTVDFRCGDAIRRSGGYVEEKHQEDVWQEGKATLCIDH